MPHCPRFGSSLNRAEYCRVPSTLSTHTTRDTTAAFDLSPDFLPTLGQIVAAGDVLRMRVVIILWEISIGDKLLSGLGVSESKVLLVGRRTPLPAVDVSTFPHDHFVPSLPLVSCSARPRRSGTVDGQPRKSFPVSFARFRTTQYHRRQNETFVLSGSQSDSGVVMWFRCVRWQGVVLSGIHCVWICCGFFTADEPHCTE